jgi:hypothetical protein
LQRVDRQEIIVVDHKNEKSNAINPATGDPYTVWFVNNLSHSQGTFESPFNTLAAAENASGPNDIIYVFPGDGTATGMNSGIILKSGQQFLGAGINQKISTTQSKITIPAQASGLPIVSNTNDPLGLGVQLVASNNVVSGFNLKDTQGTTVGALSSGALSVMGGSHYTIKNNTLSTLGQGSCINIYGGGDNTVIKHNTLLGLDSLGGSMGVFLGQGSLTPNVGGVITIMDNLFTSPDPSVSFGAGIDIAPSKFISTSLPDLTIVASNNTINVATTTSNSGIFITNSSGGPSTFTGIFNNNQITLHPADPSSMGFIITEDIGSVGPLIVSLENNTVQPSPPATGYQFVNNTGNPANLQVNFGSNQGTVTGP